MRFNFHVIRLLLAIATLISAASVFASDGQLEINQACAVNTGCFSGDTPGFPVTIDGSAGRSYRLTGDLTIPSVDSDGILISASDISIDLGGFTIMGLACVGAQSNCTPSPVGEGSGVATINAFSDKYPGISVNNGSIIGMGAHGVLLGNQAEVSSLRVRWNGTDGIRVRIGSMVSGNTAYQNGDDGISAGPGSTVSGNTADENRRRGIFADQGSTVSGNTVYGNVSTGIAVGNGSTVSDNTARGNDNGISASGGSTVYRNTLRQNRGFGLSLDATAAYRENVISSNFKGTVFGGLNMFSNSCNGKTSCP